MPMTLAKETMEMHWKEERGEEKNQILLEGDMIVPDTKPDLQEILCCEGRVHLRDKRISDDRISFSGEVEICVLYRAKEGEKPLYAMKTALPMEEFLHMEGLEKGMDADLTGKLEHLDCQIINDRKISLKAVLLMEARAEQKRTSEILRDMQGEGMETLTETLRMEQEKAAWRDRFIVKEEVTLPQSQPEIGEVLMEQVQLTDQEIRPMEGKAMVRGNLCIRLLYMDEEGRLGSLTEKIPFSGYLEQEDIDLKTNLTGRLTVEEYRLTPAMDEDGETRQLHVDATIGAGLTGKEIVEEKILLDAYAPAGTVSLQKEKIRCPLTVAEGKNQFTIRERIHLHPTEIPMLRAEMVWGDARLSEERISPDGVTAEGVLQVHLLYHCSDDGKPICLLQRGIPFVQTMELKGIQEEDRADVKLSLEELDFQMLSETEGELRATLTMEAIAERPMEMDLVTDGILSEEAECRPKAGAVIYMVQKGDSLWKIAKKYRTTTAEIAAVNELENPDLIYPGQKLLIIRMKR